MAKARAVLKRLKAVRNIRKITRTMELIATARFKKAMDRATEAAALLRADERVEEVAHYGHTLRVATRGGVEAVQLVREVLSAAGMEIHGERRARVTVEDAFVAMVRADGGGGR